MERYELAVIGGGPAGYHGAAYASDAGMKTVLFEGDKLGGTCLNRGCIPTKTFLHSAKLLKNAKKGTVYGVNVQTEGLDHTAVLARKKRAVTKLVAGVASTEKRSGVDVIAQRAEILSKDSDGFVIRAGDQEIKAARVMVATGSESVIPPIMGLDRALESGFAVTSTELLDMEEIPSQLVIVGGGVIGLEMACYYAIAGSKVTVIEALPQVGGPIDKEVADELKKELEQLGIAFMLEKRVYFFGNGELSVMDENGSSEKVPADKVLISVGRKPKLEGIGVENAGVKLERGRVSVDDKMQAGVDGLYFVGDCNGKSMLAHTAYAEAECAVDIMLGKEASVDYDAVPGVIYTSPEVATVGLDEATAKQRGLSVVSAKLPMSFSGRYVAENDRGNGFIKGVAEKGSGRLLGIQVIGDYASEFIIAAGIMIKMGCTVKEAAKMIYPHPTNSEMIKTVCEALADKI